jgi:D-inositol-3-phosphate glycosyltransferase
MTRVAMLSMHTSPLAPLGIGDGGGMNVYVRELSDALSRRGVDVDVFTASSHGTSDVIDLRSRVRVHTVDVGGNDPVARAERFADAVGARLADAGGTDLLHAHYWLSGIAGHRLKHDLDIPLVSTFHTLSRVKQQSGIATDSPERAEAEQAVMGCSDAVIASNLVEVGDIRRNYDNVSNIEIVTPGIDTAVFKPGSKVDAREQLGLPLSVPLIVFAGRIQHAKGLDRAVTALAQVHMTHPDAEMIVIGGPSGVDGVASMDEARSLVSEFAMDDRVSFIGPQSREQLATYLRAADVCIVPSRTESFGLIALEAAACGTPVVASAVGGLQFIVQHGRTGFVVRDIDELAGATDHLLAEPERTRRFGDTAALRAKSFTWTAAARQMMDVYGSVQRREMSEPAPCMTA